MGCAQIESNTARQIPGSAWHNARQHVEIATLGVQQVWNNPLNANVWDQSAMVNRILQLHAGERVTINRDPIEVAANVESLQRHESKILIYK